MGLDQGPTALVLLEEEELGLGAGHHLDVAPSTDLRKWYDHNLTKGEEFKDRYCAESNTNS